MTQSAFISLPIANQPESPLWISVEEFAQFNVTSSETTTKLWRDDADGSIELALNGPQLETALRSDQPFWDELNEKYFVSFRDAVRVEK